MLLLLLLICNIDFLENRWDRTDILLDCGLSSPPTPAPAPPPAKADSRPLSTAADIDRNCLSTAPEGTPTDDPPWCFEKEFGFGLTSRSANWPFGRIRIDDRDVKLELDLAVTVGACSIGLW